MRPFNQFFHPRWSQARCREAYRALIFTWHPDRNQTPDATRVTQEINSQYATAKRLNPQGPSDADALPSQVEEMNNIYRDANTEAGEQARRDAEDAKWRQREEYARQAREADARQRARRRSWREDWKEAHEGEPESWRYRQETMF